MSATDELRKLLDERGVPVVDNMFGITWDYYSNPHTATESMDGTLIVSGLTPEQAIAATLGSMSATVDDVLSLLDEMNEQDRIEYADYSQLHDAIAATLGYELNPDGLPAGLTISDDGMLLNWRGENYVKQSTLGNGTCEPDEAGYCPYCGEDLVRCDVGIGAGGGAVELDPPIYYNYCPNCGARVERREQ